MSLNTKKGSAFYRVGFSQLGMKLSLLGSALHETLYAG